MRLTDGPVLSSFESWSAAVGPVLRYAGLTDFLGNEDRKRDLAEDDSNLEREIGDIDRSGLLPARANS